MRVTLALLLVCCDAGVAPSTPPAPRPTTPAPIADAAPAEPPTTHTIDWQLGGLGVWKGQTVGGILWHVEIDLAQATVVVTDPGGVRKQSALSPDKVREYARLAAAVRAEPHGKPRHSCTDRLETLRIDTLELSDSCPLSDPGAAALTAAINNELRPFDR